MEKLAQGGSIALDVAVNGASIDLAALKQTSNEREEAKFLTEAEIRRRECEENLPQPGAVHDSFTGLGGKSLFGIGLGPISSWPGWGAGWSIEQALC